MRTVRIDVQAVRARYGTGLGHVSRRWDENCGRSTSEAQIAVCSQICSQRRRRRVRGGVERETGVSRDGWGSRSVRLGGGLAEWGFRGTTAGPRATRESHLKVARPGRNGSSGLLAVGLVRREFALRPRGFLHVGGRYGHGEGAGKFILRHLINLARRDRVLARFSERILGPHLVEFGGYSKRGNRRFFCVSFVNWGH